MKNIEWVRINRLIFNAQTRELVEEHKSINAAKRHSRRLQTAGGSLGDGRLRAVRDWSELSATDSITVKEI